MQQRRRASVVPVPGTSALQSASAPRFSEAELATFAEVFALFAVSSSGEVPLADIGTMVRTLEFEVTDAELHAALGEFERRHRSELDHRAFLSLLGRLRRTPDVVREADLKQLLQLFEEDSNPGYIILKDLRKILTSLGDRLLDSEVTTLLSVLGDGDKAATAPPPLRSPSLSISPPSSSDSAAGEIAGSDGPSSAATSVDSEPAVQAMIRTADLVDLLLIT